MDHLFVSLPRLNFENVWKLIVDGEPCPGRAANCKLRLLLLSKVVPFYIYSELARNMDFHQLRTPYVAGRLSAS